MADLLLKLTDFIKSNSLLTKDERFLLAVSGGFDSMFLLNFLYDNKYNVTVAHCNFDLRGEESEGDEELIRNFCNERKIEIMVMKFNTLFYAVSNSLSVQMAARNLRYSWFQNLCIEHGFTKIVTAHHKSDNAETMLINLVRGTGFKGLEGIHPVAGNIVRPLLCLTRYELKQISNYYKFDFREDSSNTDDKYFRNNIRKNVIPEFYKLNHSFEDTMYQNAVVFSHTNKFVNYYLDKIRKKIINKSNENLLINIPELLKCPQPQFVLYSIVSEFGFNAAVCTEMFRSLEGISGKSFYSATHIVLKDRNELIVQLIITQENPEYVVSAKMTYLKTIHHQWLFKISGNTTIINNNEKVKVDFKKLKFPLTIRKWQIGDKIKPLGMKGTKKLSDIFIDKKLSKLQKNKTWVVESENNIVWVSGIVINDDYKLTEATKKVYEMSI